MGKVAWAHMHYGEVFERVALRQVSKRANSNQCSSVVARAARLGVFVCTQLIEGSDASCRQTKYALAASTYISVYCLPIIIWLENHLLHVGAPTHARRYAWAVCCSDEVLLEL